MKRFSFVLIFLAGTSAGYASDLLKNPDLKEGLEYWDVRLTPEYRQSNMPEPDVMKGKKGEKPFFRIDLPYGSGIFYARLEQAIPIVAGKVYHLEFDLRGSEPNEEFGIWASQMIGGKPLVNGLGLKIKTKTDWERYEILFKVPEVDSTVPAYLRACFGLCQGAVDVRDFSLTEAKDQSVAAVSKRGWFVGEGAGHTAAAGPAAEAAEPVNPNLRTWTTARGSSMEGEFISYTGGMVTLKKADTGKEIRIPMLKLSQEDQDFVRSQANP